MVRPTGRQQFISVVSALFNGVPHVGLTVILADIFPYRGSTSTRRKIRDVVSRTYVDTVEAKFQ